MISKVRNIKTRMVCLLTASIISIPALALATESRGYPKTIGVLAELYTKGLATWHHLKAYELQAKNEAQSHHREKLETIYSYSGHFFGALTAIFSKHNPRYFICRQTGTIILDKLPSNCPVQGGSTSSYIELVEFETPKIMTTCSPNNGIV